MEQEEGRQTMSKKQLLVSIGDALACLPRELQSIIGDYGSEWPHKWSNDGSQPQTAVIVAGNRLTSRAIRRPEETTAWYRIVSTQTIQNGPKRWKIRFSCMTAPVCIAVGITIGGNGGNGNGIRRTTGKRWSDAATAEDVLITALMRPAASEATVAYWMFANKSTILQSTIRQVQAADRKSILVEADRANGWLRINGKISINLSDGLAKTTADWRPCVVVSGGCVVTIEDWPVSRQEPVQKPSYPPSKEAGIQ